MVDTDTFVRKSQGTNSRRNVKPDDKNRTSGGKTIVEVEVAESVTVRNNNSNTNQKTGECCCCPATFNSNNNRRTHVCYCPLYDLTHVLCPALMANEQQEDCGCGNKMKCCMQPFVNHSVTYSLCPNDCVSTPRVNQE